jgi:peptide/nickel transport system substrate-binding protein
VISNKWLISLGLLFLMAVTFTFSACAPPISDDNGIVDDEVVTEYRVGGLSMMDSLNMQPEGLMYTNVGCLYMIFNYENLAAYPKLDGDPPQSNYDFIPRLATDYTVTYDEADQVWTITLREGVTWHDGEDFTADDVVYSLMYVQNKYDVTKPVDWNAVEEDTEWEEVWSEHVLVEADGPYTVKMTYIDGWHQPEDYVPNWWMYDPIVPEHVFGPEGEGVYDGWNEDPHLWDGESIGTGPYKLIEFEPDQYVLFERFGDYWGPKPAAEKHLFRFYGDPGSLNTALEAGAIDSLSDESIPFLKIASYEADPNIEVSFDKGLSVYYMGFNLHPDEGYEPLQDRVLRQAIAYAIDEQNIVALIYGGYGEVPSGFIFSESPNYNPDLPDYSLDQEKSSELLEDAGYTKVNDYWHTPDGEKKPSP